jgi:hypothetical protein
MQIASHPHNVHSALNARLRQAFPLTDEDLEVNRTGHLTQAQKTRLQQYQETGSCLGWWFVLLIIPIGFLLITGLGRKNSLNNSDTAYVLLLILCLVVGAAFLFGPRHSQIPQDIEADTVKTIQGRISRGEKRRGEYFESYPASIGHETFSMPYETYEAFVDGETYVLYYAPLSRFVVAAEHVEVSIPS